MNNKDERKEIDSKAGNPLFIIIIFLALIGFMFYAPTLYAKYHKNVADVLGIGKKTPVTTPVSNKQAVSAYYQIGSNKELTFNEIKLSNVNLENNILSFDIETEDTVDLESLHYYLDFYEERQTFLGRRILLDKIEKKGNVKVDVSGMKVTSVTYFQLSHVDDSSIPKSKLETDESGIGSLDCSKNDIIYMYTFNYDKLTKVIKKYTYTNSNIAEYSSELTKYQKYVNKYNDLNGLTATIVENGSTFIFTLELDYTDISEFKTVDDYEKFKKDELSYVLKFKMEAEGYTCE